MKKVQDQKQKTKNKSSDQDKSIESPKKTLSSGLMGMKFMQRQQEAELRKKLQNEQKMKIDESHWVVEGFEDNIDSFPTVSLMNESTFDFSVGRMSFNDFNPTIEKLNNANDNISNKNKQIKYQYNRDDEAEISSLQMAGKLTSFKRKRSEMDPPTNIKEEDNNDSITSTNFYNRNRKSKKAMRKRK